MISELLKKTRIEKGLTQKQLSDKSGVSETAIKQYEGDKRQPRIEQLQMLASALEVSMNDLLPTDISERIESDLEEVKKVIKTESDLEKNAKI
jgi:transcriptional regulator with XRE-family HTH domain